MSEWSRRSLVAFPVLALLAGCQEPGTGSMDTGPATSTAPVIIAPSPAAGLSGSTVSPGVAGARLSPGEVQAMLANNTVNGVAANGQPYYAWFGPDGAVHFRQGGFVDTGRWRVVGGGQLCSRMQQINGGAEECYTVYRTGNVMSFEDADGKPVGNFQIMTGNPQNL